MAAPHPFHGEANIVLSPHIGGVTADAYVNMGSVRRSARRGTCWRCWTPFEWHGVFVPSGTPPDIVARLQKAVAESLQDEDVKKRFSDVGAQPIGSTPAEFADYLKKEDARWGEVVRKGNIKLD
jgi:hypothetical protein